ncbi:MAG TPA: hypothetical protein VGQ89_15835 [Candidatus Limnocylindrales bacterium]|nr:hypothetical protein [Candidatus Limnocylindrales bacterium]
MWVASVAPGFLAAFALASISGFVAIAGTFLSYDARGGIGPLAAVDDSKLILISRVCSYVVAPVTFAIATWRIGLLGALAAALGFVFLGPLLWGMSPWSSVDSSARLGYYDEGRGWIGLGLFLIVFLSFVIVVPITFVVRQIWRRSRHAA